MVYSLSLHGVPNHIKNARARQTTRETSFAARDLFHKIVPPLVDIPPLGMLPLSAQLYYANTSAQRNALKTYYTFMARFPKRQCTL